MSVSSISSPPDSSIFDNYGMLKDKIMILESGQDIWYGKVWYKTTACYQLGHLVAQAMKSQFSGGQVIKNAAFKTFSKIVVLSRITIIFRNRQYEVSFTTMAYYI